MDVPSQLASLYPYLIYIPGIMIPMFLDSYISKRNGLQTSNYCWEDVTRHQRTILWVMLGVIAFLSMPYWLAAMGVYVDQVFGPLFMGSQYWAPEGFQAVHLGHHHGTSGAIMWMFSIAYFPQIRTFNNRKLRDVIGLLDLAVGVNAAYAWLEDWTNEQLGKRCADAFCPWVPDIPWIESTGLSTAEVVGILLVLVGCVVFLFLLLRSWLHSRERVTG